MAITTIAGLYNSYNTIDFFKTLLTAGNLSNYAFASGFPRQFVNVTTAGGAVLTDATVGNQIGPSPATGDYYISEIDVAFSETNAAGGGALILCDRLWTYGGAGLIAGGTATINSPTLPARDQNGTTNGEGVYPIFFVGATAGAAISCTMSYTNSAGTAGRTTSTMLLPATSSGSMALGGLQNGDTGVQSIQTVTLSANTTGILVIDLVRPILSVASPCIDKRVHLGPLETGCPKLFPGTSLSMLRAGALGLTAGGTITVSYG